MRWSGYVGHNDLTTPLARDIVNDLVQLFGTLCNSLLFDVVGTRSQDRDVTKWDLPDAGLYLAGSAVGIDEAGCVEATPVNVWRHPADDGASDHRDSGGDASWWSHSLGWWRHCPGMAGTGVGHVWRWRCCVSTASLSASNRLAVGTVMWGCSGEGIGAWWDIGPSEFLASLTMVTLESVGEKLIVSTSLARSLACWTVCSSLDR